MWQPVHTLAKWAHLVQRRSNGPMILAQLLVYWLFALPFPGKYRMRKDRPAHSLTKWADSLDKKPKGQRSLTWVQRATVNLPQNLMQPFPHPNDAIHKIWSRLANWLQRYSSSKVWNFRHSRASNSKMSSWFGPKSNSTKLLCLSWLATLMMIQSKMNKLATRHHFPIISIWEIF